MLNNNKKNMYGSGSPWGQFFQRENKDAFSGGMPSRNITRRRQTLFGRTIRTRFNR